MKKTTIMRIASTLLIAVLLTTCAIGATFAKYVADSEASDTARVAMWSFTFNGTDIVDNDITIDLFNDTSYTNAETAVDVNGANNDAKVIAPGTTGSFVIELYNMSEVAAHYSITFAATNNNNIPIEYSLNGTTWVSNIADLNPTGDLQYGTGTPEPITVQWRWAFTGAASTNFTTAQTDGTDTTLGTDGAAEVTVTATINVEQMDVYPAPTQGN